MNYESFFHALRESDVEVQFDNKSEACPPKLSNEALFHLPLIAITILLLAKDRRKPKANEIGQLIGECFERTFTGFKGSSQHLGWSANLRMRTVRALTFLETAKLVSVEKDKQRITIEKKGKKVIIRALEQDTDLAFTLKALERTYRNIAVEKQISLEI